MKLRIKGNSIRLRLTKSDIDTLAQKGIVEEHTQIGDIRFGYTLRADEHNAHIRAAFDANTITVYMPTTMVKQWTTSERVGYETHMPLAEGSLFILLEKDFKCLDDTHEDQSDMYDNPLVDSHK